MPSPGPHTPGPGPIEAGLQRASTSFADAGRLAVVLPTALLAPLAAPAAHGAELAAAAAAVLATATAAGVWLTRRRAHAAGLTATPAARAVQALDVLVLLAICLLQPELVGVQAAQAGAGLAYIAVQMALIVYAVRLRTAQLAVVVPVLSGGYLLGSLRMDTPGVAAWTGWLLAVAVITHGISLLLFRAAAGTDRVLREQQEADRARALAAGRRADERARLAILHDTVASTLLMVGSGTVHRDDAWLRAQARRDLAVLTGPELGDDLPETLDLLLAAVVAEGPLQAQGRIALEAAPGQASGPASGTAPPAAVLRAVAGAVREALTNVQRHAGPTARVRVTAGRAGDGFYVLVADTGVGFDPDAVGDGGHGLRDSVLGRCREAGVRARVQSSPGAGSSVRLEWSGADGERAGEDGADAVRAPDGGTDGGAAGQPLRLAARLRLGVLLIPLMLFTVLEPLLVTDRSGDYRSVLVQYLVMAVLAAVVLAAGALELSGRPGRRTRPVLLAVTTAALLVAVHGVLPGELGGAAHWTLTDVGWVVCVVLTRSRPAVVVAALLCGVGLNLSPLLLGASMTQANAVTCATLVAGITVIQLATALSTRMVGGWAEVAQQAARADAAMATLEEVAVRVHDDRSRLYQDLAERVEPLLHGLADGTLDPGEPAVRHDAALEATRLRRLLAENDAVATPLLHELRAAVDVAERRGIAVHLVVRGEVPALDLPVRRALIDPVAAVLTAAGSRARVTVFIDGDDVSVSVLADVPAEVDPVPVADQVAGQAVEAGVTVSCTRGDEGLWLDAQLAAGPLLDSDPARWVVRPSPSGLSDI